MAYLVSSSGISYHVSGSIGLHTKAEGIQKLPTYWFTQLSELSYMVSGSVGMHTQTFGEQTLPTFWFTEASDISYQVSGGVSVETRVVGVQTLPNYWLISGLPVLYVSGNVGMSSTVDSSVTDEIYTSGAVGIHIVSESINAEFQPTDSDFSLLGSALSNIQYQVESNPTIASTMNASTAIYVSGSTGVFMGVQFSENTNEIEAEVRTAFTFIPYIEYRMIAKVRGSLPVQGLAVFQTTGSSESSIISFSSLNELREIGGVLGHLESEGSVYHPASGQGNAAGAVAKNIYIPVRGTVGALLTKESTDIAYSASGTPYLWIVSENVDLEAPVSTPVVRRLYLKNTSALLGNVVKQTELQTFAVANGIDAFVLDELDIIAGSGSGPALLAALAALGDLIGAISIGSDIDAAAAIHAIEPLHAVVSDTYFWGTPYDSVPSPDTTVRSEFETVLARITSGSLNAGIERYILLGQVSAGELVQAAEVCNEIWLAYPVDEEDDVDQYDLVLRKERVLPFQTTASGIPINAVLYHTQPRANDVVWSGNLSSLASLESPVDNNAPGDFDGFAWFAYDCSLASAPV